MAETSWVITLKYFSNYCESQVIEEAVLTDALRFIDKARRAGGGALVHCAQGKSRSGTVCVAFVAAQENCSIADALAKAHHPTNSSPIGNALVLRLDDHRPMRAARCVADR